MLQPKYAKQLDSNIKELVANGGSNEDIDKMASDYTSMFSDEALKKKEKSVATATPPNSVSGTPIGSSGGVNPAFKSSIPSPIPDFNSMPKSKEKPKAKEDKMGFGGALLNRANQTTAITSKSIYDAPKMILDAIYAPQNWIADKLDIPSLKVSPETYAYENIPSQILDKKLADNNAKIQGYKNKIGGDIVTSFEKGDYVNTLKHASLNSMESASQIAIAMLTGGESIVANSFMIGSTASTQYDQLSKSNPKMGVPTKLANSAVNGALEVVVGKYLEGINGNVWKALLKDKGAKEATQIATNSFRKTFEKVIGESPMVGVAGNYAEERITDGLQQLNDIATGAKTEFDWNQNKNSGLSSLGFSLPNATALYSTKAYVSTKAMNQVKSSNKEIMNLQNELQKPDVTPENKKLIIENIDKIYTENKNVFGEELKKFSAIQDVHKKELVTIDKSMDKAKSKAIDIKHDININDETKASLLKSLGEDFKKNLDRKNEILTKTPFELLSDGEKIKRQDKASREIMKEKNPDGTKSITIKDEESQKLASDNYDKELLAKKENEQTPPTSETKPQAEVPQQAEAEKVENEDLKLSLNDSPEIVAEKIKKTKELEAEKVATPTVEDVVAPSVEESINNLNEIKNPDGSVETEYVFNNKPIKEDRPFMFLGKKFDVDFESENIKIEDIIPTQPTMSSGNIKRYINDSEKVESTEIYKINGKYFVRDGHHRIASDILKGKKHIDAKVKDFDKALLNNNISNEQYQQLLKATEEKAVKTKNEATPPTNTPTDGNVRPTANDVGEEGITKSETPNAESVPSAVDGGENKGVAEVEKKSVTLPNIKDIEDFINETYLKDEQAKPTTKSNAGAKKRSPKKNIDIPEGAGKSKPKEVKLDENGFVIVSNQGKTPLEKRKFKGDRKEAVSITPSDARSVVLSFFAKGGKIASSYFAQPGELKARNNGINGIATSKAKGIDGIAHDLWESQENKTLKLDTAAYKEAIEEVVRGHNNIQDVVDSLLKYGKKEAQESPKERQENFQAYNDLQVEEKATDEEMQKALNVLDQLSEAEIIELNTDKEKGFEDYLKDLEERQVTYDLGPFTERGTLQADGSIISENGDYVSKESVTNVKQVNPKIEAKKEISKDSPELKEVNAKLVKANEKLRTAKDALDRKAKSLDKELLKDNEDIFGERKNQNENKLFDERVDGNARNKATEKERKAITDAQNEIKSLKEAKAKIESGEIVSTKEMDLDQKIEDFDFDKFFEETKNQKPLTEAEIKAEQDKENEERYQKSSFDKKWAKTYKEAKEKLFTQIKEAEAVIAKWEAKVYKKSDGSVYVGSELDGQNVSYNRINENRKRKNIENAKSDIAQAKKDLKTLGLSTDEINSNLIITKQQIKEKANAEVDRIAKNVKDLLPGIKDPDLKVQGFSQDQLIDLIATAVKKLISAGIDVNEAITQVVDSIKAKFGDIDIDIDAVKEKINPTKEKEAEAEAVEEKDNPTEERKFNSKDLLSKMTDVPNSGEIGKYISRDNIEDSDAEEEFTTNQDYDKLKLIDALIYGKSIIEQAKADFGDNYIDELIKNINAIKNVDSKTLHIISLENDLRKRRKETADVQEKEYLTEQINRLQPISQKLANTVSRALNLNKLRKLSEAGVNPNDKSNSIYTKEELETKHEIAKSFGKDIDDIQEQYEEVEKSISDSFEDDDFVSEDFELKVPTKRRSSAEVKKDISDTIKEMRKALLDVARGNSAMASIPYAKQLAVATPFIAKLTKHLAELGMINGKKAIDYVHKEINKVFPGIKKSDVADIIKKSNVSKKQNLTEEEIFQKKIDQKIRQAEKALQDHRTKKPKFAVGANSVWSEQLSAIKTELSNLRNENSDAKKKARELKNKAVELLINSGYGKEINVTKKEVDANGNVIKVKSTKKILDWKKLAGESGSVANISKAIEKVLADQNLSKNEISEMVTEMKTAIEEIKTSITEKSLTDLQNRNKIPKTVNVKTEAKNLSELYNQGIFDDNMDKYDIALNRILGFNQFREKQYQDLKDYSKLLSGLFANKNIFGDTNEFMSEDALKTQVAHINKQINEIVNKASMGEGFTPRKVVSLIRDYSDMALLSKLLSLKQLIENPWSGFTERKYQQIGSMFDKVKLTPELKNQINKGAWKVFKDISVSGSPDLGDSSFSDIRSRKIDDKIRGIKMGEKASKIRNSVASIVSGTVYLNGADSYNKVKILETVFAKAMIDILSNKKYGRNNTMTVKEATIFVSEALTGESFNQALIKAEQIIKETNKEAGKEILPYTDANIYRLAMDTVRDNLTSTGVIDAETVKAVFAGSFKAAGSSLGHESNNVVSELYKKSSQEIDRKIREAVKKKDWVGFTKYVTLNVMKNITMPFVSGRFNWVVIGAQKSGANLGLSMLVTANKKSNNKIDFSTEEGVKNLSEAVHWKIRHDLTVKRSVIGLSLNILAISVLAASGAEDDLEKLLDKSPILKRLFKWLGPPLMNLYLASQKEGVQGSLDFILDFYSVTGNEDRGSAVEQFKILLDDKANDKQKDKAKGVIGKAVGKAFDTPIPWRLGKDIKNISNEIKGEEQYVPNYNATSFLSGAFQGGFFEAIGMREMLSGHEEEKYVPKEDRDTPEYKFDKKQKDIKEYNDLPKSERRKVDANNSISSLRSEITELENMKIAVINKTPYLRKGGSPRNLSNYTPERIDKYIARVNEEIEKAKKEAGDRYTEPKE